MGAFAIFSRPIRQKEIFKHEKQHSKKRSIKQSRGRLFYLLPVITFFGMVSLFLCQPSVKMQDNDQSSPVSQADGSNI